MLNYREPSEKRAEGEGVLRKNEILEVETVDPFNASFSRQPGEYFLFILIK